MPHLTHVETLISALTLAGSLSSVVGSTFILACYAILPLEYHFRHVLILNLSIAGEHFSSPCRTSLTEDAFFLPDFINAVTNTVGGIYILSRKRTLEPGPACVFQGLVGQVTVQVSNLLAAR